MSSFIVHRLPSAIVISAVCALLVACGGSADSGTASSSSGGATSSDGTSPAPADPKGFCARKCIEADLATCETWAKDFSGAFLSAYEACGDTPACLKPKLQEAPLTERQSRFAEDYCKPCGGESDPACVDRFWSEDGPGENLRMFSDAKLDEIDTTCLPALAKNEGSLMAKEMCALSMSTCTIDFLKGLGTVICRSKR